MDKPNKTYSTYDTHYNNPYYVDKTLLIKELMVINHVLVTAPSRFGKSLNMDMVKRFVEIEVDDDGEPIELMYDEKNRCLKEEQPNSNNYKLFQGKKISLEKEIMYKHFGRYPTIHVDFSGVQGNDFKQVLDGLREAIHVAFRKHEYLENNKFWDTRATMKQKFMQYFDPMQYESLSLAQIMCGLVVLSEVLYYYYKKKKVFVFIEEFDVPVNALVYEDKMTPEDTKQTIDLLKLIVKRVLKGSERTVERSLSNACHQIGGILSDSANNVEVSRFLQDDSFAEFYGFEETEVSSLLEKAGLTESFKDVKRMYDGYKTKSTGLKDIEIYSPWAILNYIYYKELDNYWADQIPLKIKIQVGHPKIRLKLQDMISGYSVKIERTPKFDTVEIEKLVKIVNKSELNDSDVDLFLQFLHEMGFFRITKKEGKDLWLDIPNDAVRNEINSQLHKYDSIKAFYNHPLELIEKLIKSIGHVGESCSENSVRNLAKNIEALFKAGQMPVTSEWDVHATLDVYMRQHLIHVAAERYTSGNKRFDTILFHKKSNVVFVFEWKFGKRNSSKAGHKQIFKKGYHTSVKKKSLASMFSTNTSDVKRRIYLGVQVAENYKTSITYSFSPKDKPKNVCSSEKNAKKKN
ncbi:hypothetical protein PV328_000145 [Microctonus aethiopoides]|uniref:AAA-ATPase-like domain-containing protein n=1 Tax=Microctonus aethiopoides TaxID=144406 RepID=A0AA39FU97_9HYME|nr:hypothetical protein PV328_000145 [Microctonus aethiopoides]